MDPVTNQDTAPASQDTAPNGGQGNQGDNGQGGQGDNNQQPAFTMPDAYKDKPWAAKIKSQEDLFKQIDNLDAAVGKKTIGTLDYEKATPEEIEAHHAKLRPADKSAYKFGEGADQAFSDQVADVFMKAGINAHQGNQIIAAVNEAAGKVAAAKAATDNDENAYFAMARESFGDSFKETLGEIDTVISRNTNDADKKVFEGANNSTLAAIDRLVHKLTSAHKAEMRTFREKHGIKDTGIAGEGGKAGSPGKTNAEKRSEIRARMRENDGKPNYTAAQRAADQAELNQYLKD